MAHHILILGDTLVIEHLRCQGYTGNRRFQFVSHVVDEVVLHLGIALLPEDGHNRENESDEQDQSKDDTWNHESHSREDITVHLGEMNPHDT